MYAIAIAIGLGAGVLGGLVGIGGGIIIVPLLVFGLHFDQHLAQGTTLAAMIPPIGLLAAIEYYRNGHVDIGIAAIIAVSFVVGGYAGLRFAIAIDASILQKVFGVVLILAGVAMLIKK